MRGGAVLCGTLALLSLGACTTGGDDPAGPPTLTEAAGSPAPPQARFYGDCISQATAAGRYDREGNTLRFRCTGAPARVFYDGLAAWSAKAGSERAGEGRTYRFTSKMERNPSGLDFCWVDGAGEHSCTVVLRVGEFLAFAG